MKYIIAIIQPDRLDEVISALEEELPPGADRVVVTDTGSTDGTPDLQNIIIGKDPEALDWTRLLFLHFQSGSEKVDIATF